MTDSVRHWAHGEAIALMTLTLNKDGGSVRRRVRGLLGDDERVEALTLTLVSIALSGFRHWQCDAADVLQELAATVVLHDESDDR
jgi:hypothetical protein